MTVSSRTSSSNLDVRAALRTACKSTLQISEGSEICSTEQFAAVDLRLRGELARYLCKYPNDSRSAPIHRRSLPSAVRAKLDESAHSFRERIVRGVANEAKHKMSPPNDEAAFGAQIDASYVVSRVSIRAIRLPNPAGGTRDVGYIFDYTVRDETGADTTTYRERAVFSARTSGAGLVLDFVTNA